MDRNEDHFPDTAQAEEADRGCPDNETVTTAADSTARKRIGDILVEMSFVERSIVEGAAAVQQRGIGKRIGELLLDRGHVTVGQLERALRIQSGDPVQIQPTEETGGNRIGDILVRLGLLERPMAEGAAAMQAYGIDKRLGELLVENGHITSDQRDRALIMQRLVSAEDPWVVSAAPDELDPAAVYGRGHVTEFEERLSAARKEMLERENELSSKNTVSMRGKKMTKRLGDILVELGVAARGLIEATAKQQALGLNVRLGELLLEKGAITESHLARAIATANGLPFARLGRLLKAPDSFTAALLPTELMLRLKVIPVEKDAGRLLAVLGDPTDRNCLIELKKAAGCPIDAVVSTPTEILYVLKSYTAQEARLAAEQAAVREREVAENVSPDELSRQKLREAEREVEEAQQAAQKADIEERLAAQKLAMERAEEENELLEVCFAQEKAAIEERFAVERNAVEKIISEAVHAKELSSREKARLEDALAENRRVLERQLADEKEALTRRLEVEKDAVEKMVVERVNAEKAALEARFAVQLGVVEDKLKSERRLFEERLASEHAVALRAQSEKTEIERKLDEIKTARFENTEPKYSAEKTWLGGWWIGGIAVASALALALSIYLNMSRVAPEKNLASSPPAPVAELPLQTKPSQEVSSPAESTVSMSHTIESQPVKPKAKSPRTPVGRKMPVSVRREVGFASAADKAEAIKRLESRMLTGEIVLARLDSSLALLMKQLENMKKELAAKGILKEGRVERLSSEQDGRSIESINEDIARYNKLLADAKRVLAEHESLLQQNRELAERHRKLVATE